MRMPTLLKVTKGIAKTLTNIQIEELCNKS